MSVSTILQFISKDNFRFLYISLIILSVTALASAWYVEYVLGIEPCPLCIYQRFPYLYLIKLSITGLLVNKISKYIMVAIMVTTLVSCVLATYHMGVENGFFSPSELCANVLHIPEHLTLGDIRKMLYDAPVATCTKASFKIFYISMTVWNLLLNLGIFTTVFISYIFSQKTYAKTKLY